MCNSSEAPSSAAQEETAELEELPEEGSSVVSVDPEEMARAVREAGARAAVEAMEARVVAAVAAEVATVSQSGPMGSTSSASIL